MPEIDASKETAFILSKGRKRSRPPVLHMKEEIRAKKKPVTETRTVSEEVRSEKVENLDEKKNGNV